LTGLPVWLSKLLASEIKDAGITASAARFPKLTNCEATMKPMGVGCILPHAL
jgi:hypothetical protein